MQGKIVWKNAINNQESVTGVVMTDIVVKAETVTMELEMDVMAHLVESKIMNVYLTVRGTYISIWEMMIVVGANSWLEMVWRLSAIPREKNLAVHQVVIAGTLISIVIVQVVLITENKVNF